MTRISEAVECLESLGYVVVPPADLPEIRVDEKELMARIDGFDRLAFTGHLLGRSVPLDHGGHLFPNQSVEGEYRRAVAHLAMAQWYRDNLERERRVFDLATELAKSEGIDPFWKATKKQRRKAIKAARAQLRVQS